MPWIDGVLILQVLMTNADRLVASLKMAKLPRAGVAYQCLDEQERSFPLAWRASGSNPHSERSGTSELRQELGLAIGKWK